MQNNLGLICEKKSVKGNYWFFNKPHNIKIDKLKNKYNISDILASLLINRGVEEEKISFF